MPSLMKSRQWVVTFVLLALSVAGLAGLFLTRDLTTSQVIKKTQKGTEPVQLVDESPLQTARALGKLAAGADEQQVAEEAEEFADDEVDLGFHEASRDAADHPPQNKPQFRDLYQHVGQAETQVQTDQTLVDQLKKQLAGATGTHAASLQEQLDVAQAQLELDQDELNDAKEDLVRSGADPGALIQRQFDQHQAAEHGTDAKPAAANNNPEVNYQAGHLLAQFNAWSSLRSKVGQLQRASEQAGQAAAALTAAHNALEKQVTAEKTSQRSGKPAVVAGGQPANASLSTDSGSRIKSLHLLSDDQKTLADLDKRIQDEQELQNSYGSWIALVHAHQRAALHGMIQSLLWIVLIVLAVYLAGRLIDRYLVAPGDERNRLHTLRAVISFSLQVVAVLLILLVIFGPPQQLATLLGFAGAGLTVALKDFIVAFFGWFALMGKNGLRVGDWVEINGVAGEVIEINLLRTVLLETGNLASTGHPTGRKVAFVNSYAIEGHFFNFTTSGQWLWDELQIPVPANQDPYPLLDKIQQTVAKETEGNVKAAEKEWQSATSRYRVRSVSAAPTVDLRPAASGLEVHVRYITRAHESYAMRARLNQAVVLLLQQRASAEKASLHPAQ